MKKSCTDFSISSILNLNSESHDTNRNLGLLTTRKDTSIGFDSMNLKDSCSSSPNESPPRKKKTRTVFSRQQIQHLENAFDRKKYFTNTERQKLASDLMLSETQVKIWLQNRRNKWKKQVHHEPSSTTSPSTTLQPYLQNKFTHSSSDFSSTSSSRSAPSTIRKDYLDLHTTTASTSAITSKYIPNHNFFKF